MAKKKAAKKRKAKKKPAPVGGLYELRLPGVSGAFSVIAGSKKWATIAFLMHMGVKRLPKGAKVTKSKVAVGRSCKIVCK